ncbi:Gfo/Idh/MocA family protein [Streptomyces albidoflavus]
MITRRPVSLGLIGCGLIGREHLRAWQTVAIAAPGTFRIVAVCDADKELSEQAAAAVAQWQDERPAAFTTTVDLLEQGGLDGLDVCLPVHLHESAACAALTRGIHVLVEKPLAPTIAAGRRMAEAAQAAGLTLSLAENHRRSLSIRTARWLLRDQGVIGTPEVFHAQRSRYQAPTPQAWQWRATRRLGGGGWAIDNGAHLLDTLRYLFGPVETVSAVAKRTADHLLTGGPSRIDEREDLLAGLLRFTSGMSGVFSNTSTLPGDERFQFSIQGTKGALVDHGGQLFHAPLPTAEIHDESGFVRRLADYGEEFLHSLSETEQERIFPFGLRGDFPVECAEFLRAVAFGNPVEIDGHSALETLATSLAFYESAVSGDTVRVADVLSGRVHAYQNSIDDVITDSLLHDFRSHTTRWPQAES